MFPDRFLYLDRMMYRFHNRIGKVCALAAVALILPTLMHAQTATSAIKPILPVPPKPIHAVPETNAGWMFIPFVGAVLLFSARRLFRAKESS